MSYTVRKGDTWSKISLDLFGDASLSGYLQQANKGIGSLKAGMVLGTPQPPKPTTPTPPGFSKPGGPTQPGYNGTTKPTGTVVPPVGPTAQNYGKPGTTTPTTTATPAPPKASTPKPPQSPGAMGPGLNQTGKTSAPKPPNYQGYSYNPQQGPGPSPTQDWAANFLKGIGKILTPTPQGKMGVGNITSMPQPQQPTQYGYPAGYAPQGTPPYLPPMPQTPLTGYYQNLQPGGRGMGPSGYAQLYGGSTFYPQKPHPYANLAMAQNMGIDPWFYDKPQQTFSGHDTSMTPGAGYKPQGPGDAIQNIYSTPQNPNLNPFYNPQYGASNPNGQITGDTNIAHNQFMKHDTLEVKRDAGWLTTLALSNKWTTNVNSPDWWNYYSGGGGGGWGGGRGGSSYASPFSFGLTNWRF